MYHPAGPGNVEFIELKNIGAAAINLAGCRFADGDPFAEFVFPNIALNPGGYVVVTNNLAAFTARYGASATLAGEWGTVTGLNNSGENIRLLDPNSNEVHNFSYATVAPWPTSARGFGPSIEVISTAGAYGNGANWRASYEIGGSPGYQGAGPDSDGDGQPDSHELRFGTDPNDAGSMFAVSLVGNGAGTEVSFPSVNGRQYRIDYRDDLAAGSWVMLQTVTASGASTAITDTTAPKPAQRFYRVTAL